MTGVMKMELVRRAFDLFRLYGVKSISMDEISSGLKVSKKTLYRYFDSKEELLKECVKFRISQLEIFKTLDDGLLDLLLVAYEAYPGLYRSVERRFCYEIRKYYGGVYDVMTDFLAGYAMACGKKVEAAVANGYVRRSVSGELVCLFLRERFFKLFLGEDADTGDEVYAEMILTFALGISTQKGGSYINKKLKERKYNETY